MKCTIRGALSNARQVVHNQELMYDVEAVYS